MEPDERVRVKPVPTDSVPAVDHDHADVRMIDQRVRECHPRRTSTDHEVVGFQLNHRHRLIFSAGQKQVNSGPEPGSFPVGDQYEAPGL